MPDLSQTAKEIQEIIKNFRYEIDDDAKGIYIGERSGEWGEKEDIELSVYLLRWHEIKVLARAIEELEFARVCCYDDVIARVIDDRIASLKKQLSELENAK